MKLKINRFLLTMCFFLLMKCFGFCQGVKTISFTGAFIDTTNSLTINQIQKKEFLELSIIKKIRQKAKADIFSSWKDHPDYTLKEIESTYPETWLKTESLNRSIYAKSFILESRFLIFDEIYEAKGTKLKKINPSIKTNGWKKYELEFLFWEEKTYYLKLKDVVVISDFELRLIPVRSFSSEVFGLGVFIILFFFSLQILVQFLLNKDLNFLYYFFYLATTAIVLFYFNISLEDNLSPDSKKIGHQFLPLSFGAYLVFIYYFLELSKYSPKAATTIRRILVCTGFVFLLLFFDIDRKIGDPIDILGFAGTLLSPFFIYAFYHIYKLWNKKDWGIKYVLIGSAVIFISSFISFLSYLITSFDLFNLQDVYLIKFLHEDIGHTQNLYLGKSALLIEIILFSAALGFKSKKNEFKKSKAERLLLENQLATQKKESDLQLKIANAEQKALKAQMNPHFMFNCLNSIKNLIQRKENDAAENYLVKFAELIRGVVDYSQEASISLEKELKFCELFMDMEAIRFGDNFDFEIEILDSIDTSFYTVPPFLLQPLLENALWHGLIRKEGVKNIRILVFKREEDICCMVDDNGIGLKDAKAHQFNKSKNKKSVGLKNTKERLDLFKELFGTKIDLEIVDKADAKGNSKGVMAILSIPH